MSELMMSVLSLNNFAQKMQEIKTEMEIAFRKAGVRLDQIVGTLDDHKAVNSDGDANDSLD